MEYKNIRKKFYMKVIEILNGFRFYWRKRGRLVWIKNILNLITNWN